jgi:capsular polysaccharide biosynthesis protein
MQERNVAAVMTILPPERVVRTLPLNIREGEEVLFRHELVRDLDETRSLLFKDVNLFPNGFLVSQMRVLNESFHSAQAGMPLKRFIRMLAYQAATKATKTIDKAFFATDEFSNGYFHWVCDVLPRLEAAHGQAVSDRTLIVPAMAAFPYVLPSLEPFGFPSVCLMRWAERIRCRDLLVITPAAPTGNYRPSLMRLLRKRFREYFGSGQAERRIYISRASATRRRIANEAEVLALLARYDYEPVILEDLPLKEQVLLVGSARVLVGNHGAGLANIAWMLPGTTVLELRLRGDWQNNCYFSLAAAQGIQYRYLACEGRRAKASAHSADIFVDVNELKRELALIG